MHLTEGVTWRISVPTSPIHLGPQGQIISEVNPWKMSGRVVRLSRSIFSLRQYNYPMLKLSKFDALVPLPSSLIPVLIRKGLQFALCKLCKPHLSWELYSYRHIPWWLPLMFHRPVTVSGVTEALWHCIHCTYIGNRNILSSSLSTQLLSCGVHPDRDIPWAQMFPLKWSSLSSTWLCSHCGTRCCVMWPSFHSY